MNRIFLVFSLVVASLFATTSCTSPVTPADDQTITFTADGKTLTPSMSLSSNVYATLYGDNSTVFSFSFLPKDGVLQLPDASQSGFTEQEVQLNLKTYQKPGTYIMQTTRTGSTTGSISLNGYFGSAVSSTLTFTITEHSDTRLVGSFSGTLNPGYARKNYTTPIAVSCTFNVKVKKL